MIDKSGSVPLNQKQYNYNSFSLQVKEKMGFGAFFSIAAKQGKIGQIIGLLA
ncbi:hypothetical protein ACFL1G_02920 [Planctomycetota bacterium]